MLDLLAPLSIGFFGSLHCIGMCGPLVLACSLKFRAAAGAGQSGAYPPSGVVFHQLAFHCGRLITYGLLGVLVATLFGSLEVRLFSMQYRGWITIICGITLVVMGLALPRIIPIPAFLVRLYLPGSIGGKMAGLASSPGAASKVGLGLLAGLLPCGLTWAMLITAASTLDPVKGFFTMAAFGLGTTPLLFLTGVSASFISIKTRLFGERAAAAAVIVMGILLIAKGTAAFYGRACH